MNLWVKTVSLISLNLLLLMGCTYHYEARLYDLETANVTLIKAQVRGDETRTEAVLPTGEHCKGESVIYEGDAVYWGKIYSPGYYGSVSESLGAIDPSQRRVMTMVCERGITFDCEYMVITPSFEPQGHGMCRDNGGKYYRLVF